VDQTQSRLPVNIEDEMKRSYMDYAMSVIIGRALPDVRDGLKPAHRRVLYGMKTMGLSSTRGYRKCAKIVGEVMGNYHPHGDAAIYDTLARLAQDFNMRHPLIDGQGNFGSVDGDPPAAMRYTEARLEALGDEMMTDLDKETVDFVPNYDETTEEPTVLPTPFPNLLVNGSAGIAVGMATSIPPHNMREVIDGVIGVIEHRHAPKEERFRLLMQAVPAPDFPSGGTIVGRAGIVRAYKTGRGGFTLRGKATFEESKKGDRTSIVVTEIPYQINKATLVGEIAELVREKKIEGISDLRDESSRDGMRIVIELKRGELPDVVLNNLYQHTKLQTSYGITLLAIVGARPKVLTLLETVELFVEFRRDVVRRRTEFELRKAEARAHILEGLRIALDHLDAVITLIRGSRNPVEARYRTHDPLAWTGEQRHHDVVERQPRLAHERAQRVRATKSPQPGDGKAAHRAKGTSVGSPRDPSSPMSTSRRMSPSSSQWSKRTRSEKNSQIALEAAIVGNASNTPAMPYSSPPASRPKMTNSGCSRSAFAITFGTTMCPSTW